MSGDSALYLENQLCLPLYMAAKELISSYTPLLSPLGLTYTQYVIMLALWEYGDSSLKGLGERICLDSGTLTPLLKKLEAKGLIKREKDANDGRGLLISLTEEGEKMKEKALPIPEKARCHLGLDQKEAESLYILLYKLLSHLRERKES